LIIVVEKNITWFKVENEDPFRVKLQNALSQIDPIPAMKRLTCP
jgi:hypothetical protein